eukprot:scaffold104_cov375-Prasinococcus_capsulatus_cf.AAC.34
MCNHSFRRWKAGRVCATKHAGQAPQPGVQYCSHRAISHPKCRMSAMRPLVSILMDQSSSCMRLVEGARSCPSSGEH